MGRTMVWMPRVSALLLVAAAAGVMSAQAPPARPWLDKTLSPRVRAAMVLRAMTLDEKIAMIHGTGQPGQTTSAVPGYVPAEQVRSNGGAGYVVGVPRLGIPSLQMADAAYGVTKSGETGRYSTALPSPIGLAATWDPQAALTYGGLIGREMRAQGYSMSLGGGVDLTRELRNGRTFEYGGEDPLLAGVMIGTSMRGLQAEHVVGDIKHYAVNDQESGRTAVNAVIDERSLRETDLLAFELALRSGQPGAVMCSYNRVNGDYACENHHLLTDVLRTDWKFPGFVFSDWGGTHSTVKASHAGLDQEQPNQDFYGPAYKQAVQQGTIPLAELNEHVERILFAEFASGLVDEPVKHSVLDPVAGARLSQSLAEKSIVLLKNDGNLLPLDPAARQQIAVIGGHADIAMISGGGSAQVDPAGGNAIAPPGKGATTWMGHIWFPTSPLASLRAAMPQASIQFASGKDLDQAAALAKSSDVAIVFAYQWESEAMDLPSLTLEDHQDELIRRVAAANPRTMVILESGTAVTMPWIRSVPSVVEAWYGGTNAAPALARVLTGAMNPSGKLPITFPQSGADLPHPVLIGPPPASTADFYGADSAAHERAGLPAFDTAYSEGLLVGYKWYAANGKQPLFPFGHGLSYTTFRFSKVRVTADGSSASVTVTNTGSRSGITVAQLYVSLPAKEGEPDRLAGWATVSLAPNQSQEVSIAIEPLTLAMYDVASKHFIIAAGRYVFHAGDSSTNLPLTQVVELSEQMP